MKLYQAVYGRLKLKLSGTMIDHNAMAFCVFKDQFPFLFLEKIAKFAHLPVIISPVQVDLPEIYLSR